MADMAEQVAKRPGVLEAGESVLVAARVYSTGYLRLRVLFMMIAAVGASVVSQAVNEGGSVLALAAFGGAAMVVVESLLNAIHRPSEGLANRMVLATTERRLLFLGTSKWTGWPTKVLLDIPFGEVASVNVDQRRVSFWRFGHLVLTSRDGYETDVETTARGGALLKSIQDRV